MIDFGGVGETFMMSRSGGLKDVLDYWLDLGLIVELQRFCFLVPR
jgi:hypothetical protein